MRLIHCLLLGGLLAAQAAAAQPGSEFVIRTYQVPVEHQAVIESVLGEAVSLALGLEQRNRGVTSAGQGQILVTAPPRIHADIQRFLQDFQPAEIANLRTEYWIVRGEPGGAGALPSELEPISEVLTSISAASSEMSYSLEDHVEILSRAGRNSRRGRNSASIRNGQISQQLDYVEGKVIGEFSLQYQTILSGQRARSSNLQTEIAVPPGQFIVLGRIGLYTAEGEEAPPTNLFVILRSQLAD